MFHMSLTVKSLSLSLSLSLSTRAGKCSRELEAASTLDVCRKFDKFQFPTNSLGQGSSTYSLSDKFSISTPPLCAERALVSSWPPSPLSASSSTAVGDPAARGTHSFVLHTCQIHVYTRSLMPKRCFASQTLLTPRSTPRSTRR